MPDHIQAEKASSMDSLFRVGQIRLAELSVFNWGSFNGLHTAKIDSVGTLVTGDNGAGKSTLIDGLMAILLPAGKATFNVAAAQGDRSDRSLMSYMRGSFGSVHDGAGTRVKSKRESAVVTGLRALYRADDGSQITLAALFWTTQPTNALADVKRVYVVAKRDVTLKEILDAFGEGNARAFKQWLRDDPAITCCDDRFSDYQALYRKLLYMDNKNAPALLSRALGLKKIDDLTGLIRELVLEPSTVKDDAKKVVEAFDDLVAIHDRLLDAREQQEHLSRLPELSAAIEKAIVQLEQLTTEKQGVPVYFGEVFARLWQEKIAGLNQTIEALTLKIKQTEVQKSDAKQLVERRHEEYLKYGGDRIESLKKEIGHTSGTLARVTREASRYQQDTKTLSIDGQLEEAVLLANQSLSAENLENTQAENETAQDLFGRVAGELSQLQTREKTIADEIREIRARPDSNIDLRYQKLRDELVDSLDLKKEQCMFLGELIDVKDDERHWQGAIERALGGLRTTLAVPHDSYSMVTRWLNTRHTGLHVRVQVVGELKPGCRPPEFRPNGYLRKLVWRDHPHREWLKRHLQRFDLQCVADTETLDKTPFSMTQQGLVHMDKGRFEKKDQQRIDDRRSWYLGFSNQSRLALLEQDQRELSQCLADASKSVNTARRELDAIKDRENLWKSLLQYRWEDINAPYWKKTLGTLEADLEDLEQSGGDLDKARVRWESAKSDLEACQKGLNALFAEKGGVENELTNAEKALSLAQSEAAEGLPDSARTLLSRRVGVLTTAHLNQMSSLIQRVENELDRRLDRWRQEKGKAENSATRIMASFQSNDKWHIFTVDWQCDISSLPDYLDHLRQLEEEGLPELVGQFIERLNKHATQSLARIKTRLESEREDILERIDIINRVLRRTEFRQGTHLKLGSKKEKYPHVQDFEKQLRKVLSQATSDDHEARYRQLARVVEILDKASAPGTSNNMESLRLLDPRYQMSFYAEERDAETEEVRDVLESSSGKSGGEKESFAGTIVAASLAYVLTPDGCDRPVYSTVFLDEAFSNTAEAVSRRVLRVFRELHIHVNLITPYKNLNLARESARSLLIAERDVENHDSHLCEVTWDEIDRRMSQDKMLLDAHGYGIEIEPQLVES